MTTGTPDIEAQRAAMKKLSFLLGRWSAEASVLRGPGKFADLLQTQEAQFKVDGLVLMIEGIGRSTSDGAVILQALSLISFDDEAGVYRMRAFNDGRWLETDVKLADGDNAMTWGFTVGEIRTNSVLRLDEEGHWIERAEITIGKRPPQKLIELTVRRFRDKSLPWSDGSGRSSRSRLRDVCFAEVHVRVCITCAEAGLSAFFADSEERKINNFHVINTVLGFESRLRHLHQSPDFVQRSAQEKESRTEDLLEGRRFKDSRNVRVPPWTVSIREERRAVRDRAHNQNLNQNWKRN